VPQDAVTIRIKVTDPSAQRAARIANAVPERLGAVVESLSPQRDGRSSLRVTTVQAARAPQRPASPDPGAALLLGALGGAAVGLVVLGPVVLRHRRAA
jgi:capsular polysaccharide biosynthesis protein